MATTTSATSGVGFGTLDTSSGTPRLTGTASNIDTQALIDALVQAKQQPAVQLKAKITKNEAKVAAYGDLKDLLQKLQSAVAGLRNPPGLLGVQDNVFEKKDVFYSSSTTTSPASLLSVSADNKVAPGKFSMVVQQLAAARKLSGDSMTSNVQPLATVANGGSPFSGSFSLGLAGGPSATIAVDGTMTLEDVRGAINAQSATTGVTANVVKVSDTDYRLVLTADQTGKEVTLAPTGGDDVLSTLGLSTDGGATLKHPLAAPQDAKIAIDGTTITRSSNTITDAIDGMTLNLFQADPGTTVTVEVDRSLSGVEDQIKSFVDAYNALRDFTAKQSAVGSDGQVADDAVLFGDTLLRGVSQSVSGLLSAPVAGLDPNAISSLAGIGIKLDESNHLTIDTATLEDKLNNDLDAVRNVFEFRFDASSPDLGVVNHGGSPGSQSFTLSITDADGDGIPEAASANGVTLDVSGGTIKGADGTAFAGLEMVWTGHGSTSIDVSATQGVADKLYNYIGGVTDEFQGSLTKASDDLGQRDTDYQTEIDRINQQADSYRQQLVDKYAAMETALSLANSMLEQVKATVAGWTQSN